MRRSKAIARRTAGSLCKIRFGSTEKFRLDVSNAAGVELTGEEVGLFALCTRRWSTIRIVL